MQRLKDGVLPVQHQRHRQQHRRELGAEGGELPCLVELDPPLEGLHGEGAGLLGLLLASLATPLSHVVSRQAVVHVNIHRRHALREILKAEPLPIRVAAALAQVRRVEVFAGRHQSLVGLAEPGSWTNCWCEKRRPAAWRGAVEHPSAGSCMVDCMGPCIDMPINLNPLGAGEQRKRNRPVPCPRAAACWVQAGSWDPVRCRVGESCLQLHSPPSVSRCAPRSRSLEPCVPV